MVWLYFLQQAAEVRKLWSLKKYFILKSLWLRSISFCLTFCPCLCFKIPAHYSTRCSNMEGTVDSSVDLFYDSDLWQNESFPFDTTSASNTSVYPVMMMPVMDKTINILMIVVLTITMVSMGCTMEVSKIKVTSDDIHLFRAQYYHHHHHHHMFMYINISVQKHLFSFFSSIT